MLGHPRAVYCGLTLTRPPGPPSSLQTSSSGAAAPLPPPPPPPPLLAPAPDGEWLQAVLARAFVALDHEFAVVSEGSYVGTTAVVVLMSSQRIWVAHCGALFGGG
jgi:hypothetical protein